jgi:glycosyltransferase involved in cell wall biosynthesis
MPKVIAFDTTPSAQRRHSGVSHYASNLLRALTTRGDGRRYEPLPGPLAGRSPNGAVRIAARILPMRSLWMQLAVPRLLTRLQPDLCHFTNYVAPTWGRCPLVVTFHDMSLVLHPEYHAWTNLAAARAVMPFVARRARRIIAVSHSARTEIVSALGIPPDRVDVVYEAAADDFFVITDRHELARVRATYQLPDSFVLHVGTIEPRKNIKRLVDAMTVLWGRGRTAPLVLAGPVGWKCDDILRAIEAAPRGMVRMLNYVPQSDLPALYNLARAVAFPSLYEGFGLPIVEAMACGTPVVTSNRSSMAEIAGSAASLVNPEEVDAIAAAIDAILTNPDVHAALRAAGRNRAATFSWARAADDTVAVYERACRG